MTAGKDNLTFQTTIHQQRNLIIPRDQGIKGPLTRQHELNTKIDDTPVGTALFIQYLFVPILSKHYHSKKPGYHKDKGTMWKGTRNAKKELKESRETVKAVKTCQKIYFVHINRHPRNLSIHGWRV